MSRRRSSHSLRTDFISELLCGCSQSDNNPHCSQQGDPHPTGAGRSRLNRFYLTSAVRRLHQRHVKSRAEHQTFTSSVTDSVKESGCLLEDTTAGRHTSSSVNCSPSLPLSSHSPSLPRASGGPRTVSTRTESMVTVTPRLLGNICKKCGGVSVGGLWTQTSERSSQ